MRNFEHEYQGFIIVENHGYIDLYKDGKITDVFVGADLKDVKQHIDNNKKLKL